jgi:hypothetical protein
MCELPETDSFVEVTFEGNFEEQSPIQGRVVEVDADPEIYATDRLFIINDSVGSRDVVYAEGVDEGEDWANVTLRNANTLLGENASWRVLD